MATLFPTYATLQKKYASGSANLGGGLGQYNWSNQTAPQYPYRQPTGALAQSGFGPPAGTDLTGMTGIGQQAAIRRAMSPQQVAAAGGAGYGAGVPANYVKAGTVGTQIGGYNLTPKTAAERQTASELEAQQKNQAISEQALAMLNPTDPTQASWFPETYWQKLRTAAAGDIRNQYSGALKQIDAQVRSGQATPAWAKRRREELQSEMRRAVLQKYSALDVQRQDQAEQSALQRAQLYMRLAGQTPYQGQAWTNVEDYLRGASYEDRLMAMAEQAQQQGLAGSAGGFASAGGRGTTKTSVPANEPFGNMIGATPQWAGKTTGGGGASLLPSAKAGAPNYAGVDQSLADFFGPIEGGAEKYTAPVAPTETTQYVWDPSIGGYVPAGEDPFGYQYGY